MKNKKKSKKFLIFLCILCGLVLIWTPVYVISNSTDTYLISPDSDAVFSVKPFNNDVLRLCTFIPSQGNHALLGVLIDSGSKERVLPLKAAYKKMTGKSTQRFSSMYTFIRNNDENIGLTREVIIYYKKNVQSIVTYSAEKVRFLAPLPQPLKLVDCGAYRGHSRNMVHAIMKKYMPGFLFKGIIVPINWFTGRDGIFSEQDKIVGYFVGNNLGIYGTNESIIIPQGTNEIDIEPELALVISKTGKDIAEEDAIDYIAGFLLYNDFTDRTIQAYEFRDTHYGYVKSKVINSMGPYLVTNLDINNIKIRIIINGQELPMCSTFDMYWTVEKIISYVSSLGEGVAVGQIIGLGCLTGGSLFERGLPELKEGDIVELIGNQGLGILKNKIVR